MSKIEILNIKEHDEPLLERKRIEGELSCEKITTPSLNDVKKAICDKFGYTKDHVVVQDIDHRFGRDKIKFIAFMYKEKENIAKVERRFMQRKQIIKKERAAEPNKAQPKK